MKPWSMSSIRIGTVITALFVIAGCNEPVPEPSQASLDAIRVLPLAQRVSTLLDLEQEAPESPRVQLELGLAYGTAEQYAIAERHFRAAREAAGRDDELRGQATLGLANAHLGQAELQEALTVAEEGGPESVARSLTLLRARAHFLAGETADSVAAYDEIWDPAWDAMVQTDFLQYAGGLLSTEAHERADGILTASFERHGYTNGIGFQLSAVAERSGRQSDSVLYAFLDSLNAVAIGALTEAQLQENLTVLRDGLEQFDEATRALDYALAILDGDWSNAADLQTALRFPEGTGVLPAIVNASDAPGDPGPMQLALDLLPRFTAYAPLYDALITTLRFDADYRFATMRSILETAIVVATDGPTGNAARTELARLLGFTPAQSEQLLIDAEIARLATAAATGAALDPTVGAVLASLSLPEHPYTATAIASLIQLMRLPRIREYVDAWIPGAPAAARERVETLL